MTINRRTFMQTGGALAAYAAPPSDRIFVGLIGAGGRGRLVMGEFLKDNAVRAAAVCDVYEPNLEKGLSEATKAGSQPKAYRNYKQLLADPSINAVVIGTPEHWHHRMVLDALAAGKDVYVEKPLCQTPEQGVEMIEAERKSKNIVQVGMQRRSYDLYLDARKVVEAGTLGRVRMIRSWWLNNSLGPAGAAKLEGPLDWEQWQGPVARRIALDPARFRSWRSYSDYSGGIVADQGAHVFDGIHLLMNAGYPAAVNASANRQYSERGDTPESVVLSAEYPDGFIAVFLLNYGAMRYKTRNDQCNHLDGDKARMDVMREDFKVYMQGAEDSPAVARSSEKGFHHATLLHVQNFLDCVRSRKTPTAPMRLGFQAALVPQLGNLSLKHGKRIRWNASAQKVEM